MRPMMRGAVASPALAVAGRIARMHGLGSIAVLGPVEIDAFESADPEVDVVEFVLKGADGSTNLPWFVRQAVWVPGDQPPINLGECAVMGADDDDRMAVALAEAPVVIVLGERVGPAVAGASDAPLFSGLGPAGGTIAIVDRRIAPDIAAPSGFRVVAIVTTFNEADVIGPTIDYLIGQGVGVHVIDNWSTDNTYRIAETYLDRGVVGLERFPDAPSPTFDLGAILHRVEQVAAVIDADWIVHHDADERRRPPWTGCSLPDALWRIQQSGFNAVDHTVLEFPPIDDSFVSGTDLETAFVRFAYGRLPGDQLKIQSWRQRHRTIDLASSGGHEVVFDGRRVFPYKFLLKHYPIRSQTHGERKIFVERQARWNATERSRGWHLHYDSIASTHSFLRDPAELIEFVPGVTERERLVPFLTGIGVVADEVPSGARRSRLRWSAYRADRAIRSSRLADIGRRSQIARAVVGRFRRLKRGRGT